MRCEDAQVLLSARADGERTGADDRDLDAHVSTCPSCTTFVGTAARVREHLRSPSNAPAGLHRAVMARLVEDDATGPETGQRPRHALSAAAVFVAAAASAALFVGISGDEPTGVAAADLPERVAAAQHDVRSLTARVTVTESGWNPQVPERRFEGRLDYEAPESLALVLDDETEYPDQDWPANDVRLVVDEDTWWTSGLRDCPAAFQPDCTPTDAEVRSVERRAPFSDASPAPLDLVMAVQSFALAGTATALPASPVDGRDTLGITVTAAQVEPLLGAYRATGNLREVHPADPVELRLDRETLVPLRLVVRAAAGDDRRQWAEARSFDDTPGDPVLDVALLDVEVNGSVDDGAFADPPAGARSRDEGFVDQAVEDEVAPTPDRLPEGLTPHRAGVVDTAEGPPVATRTWTDGRAWLAVSATADWPGRRMFGELGEVVRPIDLGSAGVGYLSEDGRRIGIHTADLDLALSGSVTAGELREAAESLPVRGEPVPSTWHEAATADVDTARTAIDPFLLPDGLTGFTAPALRVDGRAVTASFAGPGARSFALVQVPATKLRPPLDTADVVPVTVRGTAGRYSPGRGELEWFADGVLYRLHSESLARADLLAIAELLAPR